MSNDFEKHVRQKMDELDFVPGAPVWAKIEEQIRRKRDKRRVIFWLPVFLMLVSGSALWLIQQGSDEKNSLPQETTIKPGSVSQKGTDAGTGNHNLPSTRASVSNSNENRDNNDVDKGIC